MFIVFLLSFILTISPAKASFDAADTSFEVQKLPEGAMRFIARERGVSVFDHYAAPINSSEVANKTCYLQRTEAGTLWNYQGADLSYLTFLVSPEGNIVLSPGTQQTNYALGKSWGFKTPAALINKKEAAFAVFSSHASQFHNLGILKCLTGDFHHDYYFNRGVMHFGDSSPAAAVAAYAGYFPRINQRATPFYQHHIIDDHGIVIAEAGLRIIGLTHRIHGFVDTQALTLDNASLDVQQELTVQGAIKGVAPRIAVSGIMRAGSINPDLHITDWVNPGGVYCGASSVISVHGLLDNQGGIIGGGNITLRSKKPPKAMGIIISNGEIQAIVDEILTQADLEGAFKKSGFFSKSRRVTVDVLKHTDHMLNTRYFKVDPRTGHQTFSHETGYIFQRRTTENTQKTIEGIGTDIPPELQDLTRQHADRGLLVQTARNALKDRLRGLGLAHAQMAGILGALSKGLQDAGLEVSDIQSILDDSEMTAALTGIAGYESLTPEAKAAFASSDRDSSRCVISTVAKAQSLGFRAVDWVRANAVEFISNMCELANVAATRVRHPWVLATAGACGAGQMSVKAVRSLNKANTFYSKRHDEGKGLRGVGGGDFSSSGPSVQKSERVFPGTHQQVAAPDTLIAFPKAIRVDPKTSVQGGGKLRERWEDKRYVYEWDSRHGRIEKYSKATRGHLGEFNPLTGEQTKPSNPTWKLRV